MEKICCICWKYHWKREKKKGPILVKLKGLHSKTQSKTNKGITTTSLSFCKCLLDADSINFLLHSVRFRIACGSSRQQGRNPNNAAGTCSTRKFPGPCTLCPAYWLNAWRRTWTKHQPISHPWHHHQLITEMILTNNWLNCAPSARGCRSRAALCQKSLCLCRKWSSWTPCPPWRSPTDHEALRKRR